MKSYSYEERRTEPLGSFSSGTLDFRYVLGQCTFVNTK